MGQQDVQGGLEGEPLRLFHKRLLNDLHALQRMLKDGLFETGVHRIGGEQEMFLIDETGRPASVALEVLEAMADDHLTTELALFNLELNLDPAAFTGDCLRRMEKQVNELLDRVRQAASGCGAAPVLAGILPSLRKSDMGLANMTPRPRYFALNKATNFLRGGPLSFRLKGVDELSLTHDSVMMESCNASFQVHLQVEPSEFACLYNAAQAYAAPVLAAAVNSPLLFGRRLWHETRIALFQQAVETRSADRELRESPARVHFGSRWVRQSVTELFKEDIARFRALFDTEKLDEDPFQILDSGRLPQLQALRLHNSTIWRWNRPCYGITEGKAHLRIENRLFPSGPTVLDEMANAAFWFGLMSHAMDEKPDFAESLDFEVAKENFVSAARQGLAAQFTWLDGETVPAKELILDDLLPRARRGLESRQIEAGDIDRYLDVIAERVSRGRTGSRWLALSLARMKGTGTASERLSALSKATLTRQLTGEPVHTWSLGSVEEAGGWKHHYVRVEQYMTTDLFTVHEEDSVDLVANLMHWEHIRHLPVEDADHRLVGLISYRSLLKMLAEGENRKDSSPLAVSTIMKKNPVTVSPETETLDAIEIMRKESIGCLPVVKDGRLVGVIAERDFMVLTRELLMAKLKN